MMDWKEIAGDVGKVAPILGTMLGGPVGIAMKIGGIVASTLGVSGPDEVKEALQTSPDAAVKLREIEKDETLGLKQIAAQMAAADLQSQVSQVESVNKTLQTEAMGGSWLQKNHHAIESIFVCTLIGLIYFILPVIGKPVPPVPESAWIMLGALLGVTAWQRGQANVAQATKQ